MLMNLYVWMRIEKKKNWKMKKWVNLIVNFEWWDDEVISFHMGLWWNEAKHS